MHTHIPHIRLSRCVELLGGQPSGPDYEALVAGAVEERNSDVALELSNRCVRVCVGVWVWGGGVHAHTYLLGVSHGGGVQRLELELSSR